MSSPCNGNHFSSSPTAMKRKSFPKIAGLQMMMAFTIGDGCTKKTVDKLQILEQA